MDYQERDNKKRIEVVEKPTLVARETNNCGVFICLLKVGDNT